MYWRIQWLFAVLLVIVGFLAWVLGSVKAHFLGGGNPDPSLLIARAQLFIAPEPAERFIFLSLLVLIPFIVLGLVVSGFWRFKLDQKEGSFLDVTLAVCIALLFYMPFYTVPFSRVFMGWLGLEKFWIEKLTLLALGLGVLWTWLLLRQRQLMRSGSGLSRHRRPWITLIAGIASLTPLLTYRLIGFDHISGSAVWSDHLDAVVYPISQVINGKTLLVDLPSQYGLFPELLGLIFRFIPPSLLNLSLVFGVLQVVSMLTILFVLRRYVLNSFLLLVASLALVMATYGTSGASGFLFTEPDPYFQYWPIRFFWPAISVYTFDHLIRKRSIRSLAQVFLLTAISLVWNIDTGMAILFSGSMTLLFFGILPLARNGLQDRRQAGAVSRALGSSRPIVWILVSGGLILCCAGMIATFLLALEIKSGEAIDYAWILYHQSIFYGLGFFMIPLPLPIDAWMPVLGVYVMGLFVSMTALRSSGESRWASLTLYLSLLGLSLFIYYQGRSHFFNLVSVVWPAIMVSAILADRQLRAIRFANASFATALLPVVTISLLLVPALGFAFGLPNQWRVGTSDREATLRAQAEHQTVRSELALIRRHCRKGDSCLILAKRAGIYSLESGIASPWKGPGVSELLLTKDRDRLVESLLKGRYQHVFVGTGMFSSPENLSLPMSQLMKVYRKLTQTRKVR
jgi:hypothetical protein